MIAAKRAVSEEENRKAGNNAAAPAGAKVLGDEGRGSKGEELKRSMSEGGDGSEGGEAGEKREGVVEEKDEEEEEWEQVGPKNKSTITRQVSTICISIHILPL